MKQKKKSSSSSKTPSPNYFNPYVTTPPRERGKVERLRPRHTYQGTNPSSSGTKLKKQSSKKKASSVTKAPVTHIKSKKGTVSPKQTNKRKSMSSNVAQAQRRRTQHLDALTPEQRRMQMRKKKAKMTMTQRNQMKRRRQLQFALKIIMVMGITIGMVWGGFMLKEMLTRPTVSTQLVKTGTLDTSTMFDGIVLRNEKVINSEEQGNAKYIVAEGEKVEKGGLVYVLVDEAKLAATTSEQEEVDTQIYNKAEKNAETSNNQDQRYNLDQEVKSKFEEFYNNRYDSSTSNIYTLRSQLDSNVSSRTALYTAEQEANYQELVQLKQQIATNLGNYQKGKVVAQSGIISYRMDGYETEDAVKAIGEMKYSQYNQYRKAASMVSLAPSTIDKEDPIYKLVFNNEWYVVTYINTKEDQWTLNQSYDLHFDEGTSKNIQFTLVSKKEEGERTQLVFKSTNQIGSFLGARNVSFTIGDKDTTGLKIPIQAIVELNMVKVPTAYCTTKDNAVGVYRKKGEITEFVPLQIQSQGTDMNEIVQDLNDNSIKLNDVIVEPESGKTYQVKESEVVKGVYVVNGQVASFKEVEILVQNGDYALVRNSAKSELKEMDKIISNPKSIRKGQLLNDMKIQNE